MKIEKRNSLNIKKGVRQGDTISPKLFTLVLEDEFKGLEWEEKGIKIDGIYLHYLRFDDDVILISEDLEEFKIMIEQLNQPSHKVGLEMNIKNTKLLSPQTKK